MGRTDRDSQKGVEGMRSEKTVRIMRDRLGDLIAATNSREYSASLMTTADALDWVLGD